MSKEKLTSREVLIRFAKQYNNNWEDIYKALKEKKPLSDATPDALNGWTPVTLLDDNYPERFKQGIRPPFVFFTKGKMENLVDNMLLLIAPRKCCQYTGIERMLIELRSKKIPVIIHWKNHHEWETGNGYHLEAFHTYARSGIPFVVVLDAKTGDLDSVADLVASAGGLAITERYPLSEESAGVLPASRLAPLLAKAALLLAGRKQGDAELDLNYAVNAGIDVGALTWPAFFLDGKLCARAIQDGATAIADEEDVLELLKGNL